MWILGGICCCLIFGDFFSLFSTEIHSNSSHFVTVLCKTFQEPKKSISPEKTFPSPLSDGESEKSLGMFLPKLFPPLMQAGKMVNAAVW